MDTTCWNCKYERKADAKGYVACAYVFSEHKQDYQKTLEDLNLDSLQTGWGFMRRWVDDDEKADVFGKGIMTNNVVVFKEDFYCKYYKTR